MPKKLTIVVEGDSWCRLPDFPFMLPAGFLGGADFDLGRGLEAHGHKVYNLAVWKDTMREIHRKKEYRHALASTKVHALVLAAGGNDLLGNKALSRHLRLYDKDRSVNAYLKPSWFALLNRILADYESIIEDVASLPRNKKVPIFCHGYDYIRAGRNDIWIDQPMSFQGIKRTKLQQAIVKRMIDLLNNGLRDLAREHPNFHYVNFRNVVKANWQDVLHPTKKGYQSCAAKLNRAILRAV